MWSRVRVAVCLVCLYAPAAHALSLITQPASVSAIRGASSAPVTTECACDGVGGPLTFSFPAALQGHVRSLPRNVQLAVPGPDFLSAFATYRFEVDAAAPSGHFTVQLSGPLGSQGIVGLDIAPATTRVEPGVLTIPSGGSASATLFVQGLSATTVQFRPQPISRPGAQVQVQPDPVVVTIPAGVSFGQAEFRVSVSPDSSAGTYPLTLSEVSGTGLASVSTTLQITVVPEVTGVVPRTIAAGSQNVPVHLIGRNFQPGAHVEIAGGDRGLLLGGLRVLGPTSAELLVSARSDAAVGPAEIVVVNPDSASSPPGPTLFVTPADAVAGALAVRSVAVLSPADGALLSEGEPVYPRGLVATSGNGVLIGTWRLDGQPFDRFVAQSVGGRPVEVTAQVPIPRGLLGTHRLQLAIEQPQQLLSAPVRLVEAPQRVSALALFAPADGIVLSRRHAARFRWSIQPAVELYEVEIVRPLPLLPLRFRTRDAAWTPTAGEIAEIGNGPASWRVRPLLAGGTAAPASEFRRLVVVPSVVTLALERPRTGAGGTVLSWHGGAPGLLYRVEWLSEDGGRIAFAQLTAQSEIVLPPAGAPSSQVRVVAFGPSGEEIGRSPVLTLSAASELAPEAAFSFAAGPPLAQVTGVTPGDEATVGTSQPRIAASWQPGIDPAQVTLIVDGTDVTAVAQVTATSIAYDSLLPLDAGRRTVNLTVGGTTRSWSFTVVPSTAQSPAGSARGETTAPDEANAPRHAAVARDWALSASGTLTGTRTDGQPDSSAVNATLSANFDLDGGRAFARVNGDLSGTHTFRPGSDTQTTNRSWVVDLGARQAATSEELTVGYKPPALLGGAQILTTGLPQGMATVRLGGPFVAATYGASFDDQFSGVVTGGNSPRQKVQVAGLELPGDSGRSSLRLIGLDISQDPSPLTSGGDARLFGLIGALRLSPLFGVELEAARSSFDAPAGSAAPSRDGNAFALRLTGTRGRFSYNASLRSAQADFSNPANAGLTPASSPNRSGADLTLTQGFGRSTLTLLLSHVETSSVFDGSQDAGNLVYSTQLGQAVQWTVNGTYSRAKRDGGASQPSSDRTDWHLGTTLSETFGTVTLTQQASWSDGSDADDPLAAQTVKNVALSAIAAPNARFSLFGLVQATRTEQVALLGTTDLLQVTLNPTLQMVPGVVSLTPTVTYSRSEQDLAPGATRSESYGLALNLSPPWAGHLLTANLGASWSRTRGPGLPASDFAKTYTLSLSFRGDWRNGLAPAPLTPLPPPGSPVAALRFGGGALGTAATSFSGVGQ